MSEYMQCETEIADLEILKEALADLGIGDEHVETHKQGVSLKGYHSSVKANIVIRAKNAQSGHDVGFQRGADGKYKALVYDYDRNGLAGKIRQGRLMQCYAKRMTLKTIKNAYRRSKIKEMQETAEGKIKIRLKLNS